MATKVEGMATKVEGSLIASHQVNKSETAQKRPVMELKTCLKQGHPQSLSLPIPPPAEALRPVAGAAECGLRALDPLVFGLVINGATPMRLVMFRSGVWQRRWALSLLHFVDFGLCIAANACEILCRSSVSCFLVGAQTPSIQVCQCNVGLFCSSVGLFCLYIRPLLTGSTKYTMYINNISIPKISYL